MALPRKSGNRRFSKPVLDQTFALHVFDEERRQDIRIQQLHAPLPGSRASNDAGSNTHLPESGSLPSPARKFLA